MQSLLFANNVNDALHETLGFMLQGAVPRGLGAGCCLGFLAFMYFAHSGNEKIGDQFGAVSWQEPWRKATKPYGTGQSTNRGTAGAAVLETVTLVFLLGFTWERQ